MDVRNRFGSRATRLYCAYLGVIVLLGGCQTGKTLVSKKSGPAPPPPHIREIEYPDVNIPPAPEAIGAIEPFTVRRQEPVEYWPLTLEEAVRITLANSETMREIGGRVLTAPQGVTSVYDPAIQYTGSAVGRGSGVE